MVMKELRPDYTGPGSYHSSSRKPRPIFRARDSEQPMPSPIQPVPPKPRSASQPPLRKPTTAGGSRQHMAHTYAWVIEQEFVQRDRKDRTTEQWIFEQNVRFPDIGTQERQNMEERVRRRMWEEAMNEYEVEAERWMRHEEELRQRRVAAEAERERERQRAQAKMGSTLHEEFRRFEFEARLREKRERDREAEKRRENRYRAKQAAREREDRERIRVEREASIVTGWEKYEKQWSSLSASLGSSEPLNFEDISWPVSHTVSKPEDLTPTEITTFLLSGLHSQNLSRKERIRSAQLRWHPDRFQRVLKRVKEEEKNAVADGVGIVARCLNDLMAKEKRA